MSGNAATLSMSQAISLRRAADESPRALSWIDALRDRFAHIDLVPDLGDNIGSAEWWRGLATLTLLCGTAISTFPGLKPLEIGVAPALDASDFNEARAQMIVPIGQRHADLRIAGSASAVVSPQPVAAPASPVASVSAAA